LSPEDDGNSPQEPGTNGATAPADELLESTQDRKRDTSANPVVLDLVDVHTSFDTPRGAVHAVDGVSLELKRGTTLGIVGESGCGKTVLSRSIMGLLPRTGVIRSGEVNFDGENLVTASDKEMRRISGARIAMIFQDPMTSLHPVMKIGRQITDVLQLHLGQSKSEARRTAVGLLRSVNISEPERRINEYPHQLSGGMRQRVMIAIAIACSPELLIADEPTTALDVTVQAQILDLLDEKQRENDMAMILVTHDLGVVARRADEIAVMYAGRIVEKAPTRELFRETRMPYTHALLQSVPKIGATRENKLKVISGRPPDLRGTMKGCRFAPRCSYVQDRCREEEPPLIEGSTPGHSYRCWFPVGTPEGEAALARNEEKEKLVGASEGTV
jgi:oligopeptide/dipeptide ABC transporter ATP-binding protein